MMMVMTTMMILAVIMMVIEHMDDEHTYRYRIVLVIERRDCQLLMDTSKKCLSRQGKHTSGVYLAIYVQNIFNIIYRAIKNLSEKHETYLFTLIMIRVIKFFFQKSYENIILCLKVHVCTQLYTTPKIIPHLFIITTF